MTTLINSLQKITGLLCFITFLAGCAGSGLKSSDSASSSDDPAIASSNAVDAEGQENQSSEATTSKASKFGAIKKRKIPYRPNSSAVVDKAFADNLMAARAKEAERFLKQGADANTVSANGSPVLYTALRVRLDDIADKLVLYGADVDATNRAGRTPLLLAIERGNEDFFSYFYKMVLMQINRVLRAKHHC